MLNTEPRIVSYIAIARGQVPPEHYYRLFRTLPADRGRQTPDPRGETRTYLGVPVFEGHYRYRGLGLVPSWGGSMFEALMVPLFVPEERWAPRSWGVNHPLYVRAQIEQGLEVDALRLLGLLPLLHARGGLSDLRGERPRDRGRGLPDLRDPLEPKPKEGTATGPAREGVVTPHASFLALRFAPARPWPTSGR